MDRKHRKSSSSLAVHACVIPSERHVWRIVTIGGAVYQRKNRWDAQWRENAFVGASEQEPRRRGASLGSVTDMTSWRAAMLGPAVIQRANESRSSLMNPQSHTAFTDCNWEGDCVWHSFARSSKFAEKGTREQGMAR